MSDHIQYDFLYDNHFAELKGCRINARKTWTCSKLLILILENTILLTYIRRKISTSN